MTMTEQTEAPDMTPPEVPTALTAADRCDRCGAQAYVVTQHTYQGDGEGRPPMVGLLRWCAHHTRMWGDKLAPKIVLSELDRLIEQATPTPADTTDA